MSLQRRLTKGISVVLGVILIFMALTSMSYLDIDGFVTTVLPRNVTIARTYERFADNWNQVFQAANDSLSIYKDTDENLYKKDIENLENVVERLDNLIQIPERKENLRYLEHLCASFTKQLASYYLLQANRNRLHLKKALSRQKATLGMKAEVINLLDRFKKMLTDFNSALKNPDFQASLGNTSSLMNKISRIDKDLLLAETEIALYISQKSGSTAQATDPNQGKKAAARVENRLRAIMFLLENSIQESTTSLHKRVLNQIEKKIRAFYDSFQRLRNVLEAPESDLMEIEDRLARNLAQLAELRKTGIEKAASEAEFYWGQIFSISDQLKRHATNNHRIILAFLILVLIAGIYLNLSIPAKIGGPLKELNRQIENFKLGEEIQTIPTSNTEEIDSLAKAFQMMGHKLNLQADVNRSYLESIHSLTHVYRELHETQKRIDNPNERLEKAIDFILDQLITKCPKIDLLKVMRKKEKPHPDDPGKMKSYFVRLGDPEFSEKFVQTKEEFLPYCESTGWNPGDTTLSSEEIIPADLGLTGYFYENDPGIKTGADDNSFFQAVYAPQKLSDLPTLANREYERGLRGCVFTEPLNLPLDDPDEEQKELGLLFLYFVDPNTRLSWQDIFFIQIIASQLASIIETDNLLHERDVKRNLDEQLNMAKEIQDNLLPYSIPKVNNLKISKLWKSAAEVGGDFYDFFVLGKNRLGVVIADASGKNVPAAIIMTVFKTTLSTMELDKITADEVLTRANKVIAKNITPDRFITAMYVIINAETGEIELSSAGHNPAFVVSGRGMELVLHEKNVSCMPLGILDSYEYKSISFKMKTDDLLFLYTDGVTEARNAEGDEFGVSGLKKFLARPRAANPAEDLEKVLARYSENAGQHDDITAVSIEFKGKEDHG
jgi:serine phosphatase RsbU (regulator of sigma subunit)/HAMP domain-containing protein/phosphate uptake regulator